MIKQAVFLAMFFILMINLISATEIHLIQPQQGDVDDEDIYPQTKQFCDVDWQCTQWRSCVNGYKKRICEDANACQYKYNYPITQIACTEKVPRESANSTAQWFIFWFFTSILLLILLVILLGLRDRKA